jgi:hypothetical protein
MISRHVVILPRQILIETISAGKAEIDLTQTPLGQEPALPDRSTLTEHQVPAEIGPRQTREGKQRKWNENRLTTVIEAGRGTRRHPEGVIDLAQ